MLEGSIEALYGGQFYHFPFCLVNRRCTAADCRVHNTSYKIEKKRVKATIKPRSQHLCDVLLSPPWPALLQLDCQACLLQYDRNLPNNNEFGYVALSCARNLEVNISVANQVLDWCSQQFTP